MRRRDSRERGEKSTVDLQKIAASISERALQRQKTAEELAKEQEEQRKAEEVRCYDCVLLFTSAVGGNIDAYVLSVCCVRVVIHCV